MAKIHLEILTPKKSLYAGDVDEVVATGPRGLFGVKPGHAPLLSTLNPGELTYRLEGRQGKFRLGAGIVMIENDRMSVLADSDEA